MAVKIINVFDLSTTHQSNKEHLNAREPSTSISQRTRQPSELQQIYDLSYRHLWLITQLRQAKNGNENGNASSHSKDILAEEWC